MAGQNIDRDELRAAVRKMGTEYVFLMLNDAITLLPERKLRKLIAPQMSIQKHAMYEERDWSPTEVLVADTPRGGLHATPDG